MVSFADCAATGGNFLIEGALVAVVLPDGVFVCECFAVCFETLPGSAACFAFERV